ncbi:uncharacterized protein B0I36DRAFT_366127 [Microdochium trichocladiopsis]|uniref:Uncharacterized protein n=1 Tax=Microdochium trichocladiopsis TaxID=1682393 RepID=A0A9P8Y0Q3_9PEZI|nr:uncharacterized protein B0I36DRAFT_366127 [Microdochium trichocladiopsis]KAH7026583.1 hypothetical protein B0I36DRAFT_366127 [Microdochium trichocladiopsis]
MKRKRGVSVYMVSGDDEGAIQYLVSELSILSDNVRARSSPADKKDCIQMFLGHTATGREKAALIAVLVVVFCGDGNQRRRR